MDQAILWLGTVHTFFGDFYEPRFYGQPYNSMLESYLASIPYVLGMGVRFSLPIVTSILAYIPFLLIAILAKKRSSSPTAYGILIFAAMLPWQYNLITSLPRGFVTGTAIAAIAYFLTWKKQPVSIFSAATLAVLALSVNPNSTLLLAPAGIEAAFRLKPKLKELTIASLGFLVGGLVHFASVRFYKIYPLYNLHKPIELEFSWERLLTAFHKLSRYWGNPLEFSSFGLPEPMFSAYFLVFLGLAWIYLKRQRYGPLAATIVGLLAAIATLGINKIHDGTPSIYFPLQRMYIAIPIVVALSIFWISKKENSLPISRPKTSWMYFAAGLALVSTKIVSWNRHGADFFVNNTKHYAVTPKITTEILAECGEILRTAKYHNAQTVVFPDTKRTEAYICGAKWYGNGPRTLISGYERRTWRFVEAQSGTSKRILIYDLYNKIRYSNPTSKSDGSYVVLYSKNNSPIDAMRAMGLQFREEQ